MTSDEIDEQQFQIFSWMEKWTDQDRLDFLSNLSIFFCKHCGGHQPVDPKESCQCWNDE